MGESKCSKCGGTEDVGMTGDTPICARCYGVPGYDTPPLQPGQEVWVRGTVFSGVVCEDGYVSVVVGGVPTQIKKSSIRTEPAATGKGE